MPVLRLPRISLAALLCIALLAAVDAQSPTFTVSPTRIDITADAVFEVGPQTQTTVSDVPAGSYFVRVRARGLHGLSDPSNPLMVWVGGH